LINNNANMYPLGTTSRTRENVKYGMFIGRVLTVDYERKVLTIEDTANDMVYREVTIFPTVSGSNTSISVHMPEQFATGVCTHLEYGGGFSNIAVLCWILVDTTSKIDAIAARPIEGMELQGWSDRQRATYRKAYPGQQTSSLSGGYSDRVDTAWDRQSADWSRDRLDSDRRTWTQITGRKLNYTSAGMQMDGPINRPNATSLIPSQVPDGTFEYVYFLQPGSKPSDRYISGKQDVIPFTEKTDLVQEYSIDYPLPVEVLQTTLMDTVLGTTANPWTRTTVTTPSGVSAYDNETFVITQGVDHPTNTQVKPVGPALAEGSTPQRRGYILESVKGTLVGYNQFDQSTYGKVLKPVLFPYNYLGRFGANVTSMYLGVVDSTDHIEARLAASTAASRAPYEYNTTRYDLTKEGFLSFEVGSTLPKENIPLMPNQSYEHPHGAGRSVEGHLVGSLKLVVGKNRDEEDAIDLQALGQSVIRLGADDSSLPNSRRTVQTQMRGYGDAVQNRTLQYWAAPKVGPGDAGSLTNKTGMENISLRAGFDGGTVLRLGARNQNSLRRHLVNGYIDAPGKQAYAVTDSGRIDSKSPGRPTYGAGDNLYRFNDLTQAGAPQVNMPPYSYAYSGPPLANVDAHGLSLDVHAVQDFLLRLGANPLSGQSLLIDTAGGLVVTLGKDNQGRSITGTFTGGIELVIRPNNKGAAINLEIDGDVNCLLKGNLNFQTTGDWITECTTWRHITKTDRVFTDQKSVEVSLARSTRESASIVNNEGLYSSNENS
jgi:hypothetical protein